MTLVTQAVIFAAQAHDGAARKGSEIPYIVHPMEVVAIASTMTDDPQVLAAAALHDVMEDCGVTFETLSERGETGLRGEPARLRRSLPDVERPQAGRGQADLRRLPRGEDHRAFR